MADIPGLSRCKGGNQDSAFFCLTVCLSVCYIHTHSHTLSLTHTQLSILLSFSLLCFLFQPAALFFRAHITPTHTEPNIRRASLTQLFYRSSPDNDREIALEHSPVLEPVAVLRRMRFHLVVSGTHSHY